MDSKKEEIEELSLLLKEDITANQRFLIERELKAMKNGVHGEDLEHVEKEWDKAIRDKRSSISEHRVVDREGNIYNVKVTAIRNENYGYIGHIQVLEEIKK